MITASTSNISLSFESSGVTTAINLWCYPEFVEFKEYADQIEVIYKQSRLPNIITWPEPADKERVYKIIFSCKGGVWHKSDRIYGKIIPQQGETYEFEGNE